MQILLLDVNSGPSTTVTYIEFRHSRGIQDWGGGGVTLTSLCSVTNLTRVTVSVYNTENSADLGFRRE